MDLEQQGMEIPELSGIEGQDALELEYASDTESTFFPVESVQQDAVWTQVDDPYLKLAREYPGLSRLPSEVVERIGHGESPVSAYRAYENQQLRMELRATQENIHRRAKATGSAGGDYGFHAHDDMLDAFDSAFRDI